MKAGKEAIVPVLGQGTKDDLRLGKAKFRGMKVSPAIGDYNPGRDLVTGLFDNSMTPALIQSLRANNREERLSAAAKPRRDRAVREGGDPHARGAGPQRHVRLRSHRRGRGAHLARARREDRAARATPR